MISLRKELLFILYLSFLKVVAKVFRVLQNVSALLDWNSQLDTSDAIMAMTSDHGSPRLAICVSEADPSPRDILVSNSCRAQRITKAPQVVSITNFKTFN